MYIKRFGSSQSLPAADLQQAPEGMTTASGLPEVRYPVEFTASAGEYFRIWIVNLALTIVTLGIYSAWAKVRKRRYFYDRTRIDGEGFDYRGNPIAILKGRLVAIALLAVFFVGGQFVPLLDVDSLSGKAALVAVAVFAGPWLIVGSLKFNALNTSYRNIRFQFRGTYLAALKMVATHVWFVIIAILYPYFKQRLIQFAAENHSYGTTQFKVADFKKSFIHPYAVAYGLGILWALAAGLLMVGLFSGQTPTPAAGSGVLPTLFPFAVYLGFIPLYGYIRARTINVVWNSISIGGVRLESTLRARDVIALYVTNVLAIVCSVGFATPWAVVRTLRYRARHTAVVAAGSLDRFAAAESERVGATGEQVGEFLGFDVAL